MPIKGGEDRIRTNLTTWANTKLWWIERAMSVFVKATEPEFKVSKAWRWETFNAQTNLRIYYTSRRYGLVGRNPNRPLPYQPMWQFGVGEGGHPFSISKKEYKESYTVVSEPYEGLGVGFNRLHVIFTGFMRYTPALEARYGYIASFLKKKRREIMIFIGEGVGLKRRGR